jgi:hypothetical protein
LSAAVDGVPARPKELEDLPLRRAAAEVFGNDEQDPRQEK